MSTSISRRLRARAAALLAVLVGATTLMAAAGAPAGAAVCVTNGHVYANGGNVKYETDPINGPTGTIGVYRNAIIKFGGNGLKTNEDPFWDIYREGDGAYISTFIGSRTGGNCVSNEKFVVINLPSGPYIFRATYEPGNSGGVIRSQAHVRVYVYF
ncbi:hypothetical protein [Sphaerisporangium corydalis]|uniref:Uncharacterized protein n=1 Tax=Sphaerisporangium corydalis TaxID=1441875 RepID=A0ABV9E5Y9_9ACTN|nr:hypothetical protein [Sphaerisporangium corydalis]